MMDKLAAELERRKFFSRFGNKFRFREDSVTAEITVNGEKLGMLTVTSPFPAVVEISIANSKNRLRQAFHPESPSHFCRQLRSLLSTSLFIK